MATQVYSAIYSQTPVYEITVDGILFMRRIQDGYINATQLLKIAGLPKSQRIRILENELTAGEHFKVRGGYSKFQGTWVPLDIGRELSERFGVADSLKPILYMDENTKSEVKPGTSAKYLQFILDGACNKMGTLDGPNKNKKRTLDTDASVPKKRTKVQETKRFTDVPPPSAISSMYRDPLDPNFTDTRCISESGESQLSNFLRMSANTLSPTLQPLTTNNRPNSIQLNGLSVNNFSNHLSPSDMNNFPHPRNIVNNYQPLSPTHPLSPYNEYNVMSPNSNYSTLSPTHMIVNNFNNTLSPKQNYGNPISLHNSLANDISNSVQNSTGNTLSSPNAFPGAATLSPRHFSNQGNNPLSPGQNIVSPATTYILSPVMSNEGPVMVLSPVANPLSPNMEQQYTTPKGLFPAMVTNDPSSKQQNSYPTFFFSDPRNRPIHFDPLLDPVIQRKIAKGKVVISPKPKLETTGFQELIDAFESPLEEAGSQQELENLLKSLQDNN